MAVFIGGAIIMITAVAGYFVDIAMIGGFRITSCSITGTVHELVWGSVNDNKIWLGIDGIKKEVENLIFQLTNELPRKIG